MNNEHNLSYFTHKIDGTTFGGWYRCLASDAIEVLTVGLVCTVRLNGRFPSAAAGQAIEDFVRSRQRFGLPIPRAIFAESADCDADASGITLLDAKLSKQSIGSA